MDSEYSEKTIGGGGPPSVPTITIDLPPSTSCQHIGPTGRRCHMLAAPSSILCAHHARMLVERQCRDNDNLAQELLGDIDTFDTAGSLNLFLGNVLKQLARKRMTRKDAIALSYVSQLLLASLPVLANEKDTQANRSFIENLQRFRAAQEKEKASAPDNPPKA
jgi:hypothetical protein